MAPPPPGPTLCALLARLRHERPPLVYLGAYSCTAQLVCRERFEVFALYGAVLGVSPVDDRMPTVGEKLVDAADVDELITKLIPLWNSDYGVMIGPKEKLFATLDGDRRRLMIELRTRWPGGLSLADAPQVLEGKRALSVAEARAVAETAAACSARITWRS